MDSQILIAIVTSLGLGGIIGAYLNDRLEKRRERELHIRERKENQYKKFLENLIGFFDGWHNDVRKKNFMEELYTHAPLYASSKVIRLANKFLASFKEKDLSHGGKSDFYYRELVIAIREDLGTWNKDKLETEDIEVLILNK